MREIKTFLTTDGELWINTLYVASCIIILFYLVTVYEICLAGCLLSSSCLICIYTVYTYTHTPFDSINTVNLGTLSFFLGMWLKGVTYQRFQNKEHLRYQPQNQNLLITSSHKEKFGYWKLQNEFYEPSLFRWCFVW